MQQKKHFAFVRSRKVLFLFLSVLIGALFLVVLYFFQTTDPFTKAERDISRLTDVEYQKYFFDHIDVFYREEDINGMIQRVIKALSDGQITMFVCHSLAHDIGHYGGYSDHFPSIEEYITKENLDFCGSGFMHGVEGQLANDPYPQNVENLYRFCKLVLPKHPFYYGCYHGAGHAFMENTRDPIEAMTQCDLLRTDEEVPDVSNCYRGVFSEHSNYVRLLGKDSTYLLSFCSSLQTESLQTFCAEELNGLEMPRSATKEEVETALKTCVDPSYTPIVQSGCVHSVAGVAADHILGHGRQLLPSAIAHTFDTQLQRIYIKATYGAFIKTAVLKEVSIDAFCDSFESEERAYCYALPEEFRRD